MLQKPIIFHSLEYIFAQVNKILEDIYLSSGISHHTKDKMADKQYILLHQYKISMEVCNYSSFLYKCLHIR